MVPRRRLGLPWSPRPLSARSVMPISALLRSGLDCPWQADLISSRYTIFRKLHDFAVAFSAVLVDLDREVASLSGVGPEYALTLADDLVWVCVLSFSAEHPSDAWCDLTSVLLQSRLAHFADSWFFTFWVDRAAPGPLGSSSSRFIRHSRLCSPALLRVELVLRG